MRFDDEAILLYLYTRWKLYYDTILNPEIREYRVTISLGSLTENRYKVVVCIELIVRSRLLAKDFHTNYYKSNKSLLIVTYAI